MLATLMMENRYEKHCGRKLTSKLWNFCPYCGECLGCGANLAMLAFEDIGGPLQETACCEVMLAGEHVSDEVLERVYGPESPPGRTAQQPVPLPDPVDEVKKMLLQDAEDEFERVQLRRKLKKQAEIGLQDY